MRLSGGGDQHLGYCTNIHPGESWPEVRRVLAEDVPAVRSRLGAAGRFGVGLRLSAQAAEALAQDDAFAELAQVLAANDLYVFSINGFPYGSFHGRPVKEDVYRPDWREPARLAYTNRLALLLARLLPADVAMGSISTVPGAFKPRAAAPAAVAAIAAALVDHAAVLVRIARDRGRTLVLALEPEPCCFLETIAETIAFFEAHLFAAAARDRLAAATGLTAAAAETALRRHLAVCLDACHAAVEFEDPAAAVDRLAAAGIAIAKLQLSAGLVVAAGDRATLARLALFAEPVYLHQVVERDAAGGLRRFTDLPAALAAGMTAGSEWRVHFHVPVFRAELPPFGSTQPFLSALLARHRRRPIAPHLEVETYTWDVLPAAFRDGDRAGAIARELDWVRERLGQEPAAP